MERYLPRNLLAMVISCHRVQPRWEITWCAAAGGWWLTYKKKKDSEVKCKTGVHTGSTFSSHWIPNKICPLPWRYLLTQWAISKFLHAIQLVGLTQEGVEGLCCPMDCGGVGRDREGGDKAHLLQGGVAARCLIQELVILQVLCQTLQHRQRLVEVYLSRGRWRRCEGRITVTCRQDGGLRLTHSQAWGFWRAPCQCSSSWCSTDWGSSWACPGCECASVCGAAAPSPTRHYTLETSGNQWQKKKLNIKFGEYFPTLQTSWQHITRWWQKERKHTEMIKKKPK